MRGRAGRRLSTPCDSAAAAPEDPEINLIPFIDVLLVVLIFLMLSTTYSRFTELQVNLPSANSEKLRERPGEVIVSVAADGRYAVNRKLVDGRSVEVLTAELRQAAGGRDDAVVIISADAHRRAPGPWSTCSTPHAGPGCKRLTFATQTSGNARTLKPVAAAPAGRSRWQAWWLRQWFDDRPGFVASLLKPGGSAVRAFCRRAIAGSASSRPCRCSSRVAPWSWWANLVVGGRWQDPHHHRHRSRRCSASDSGPAWVSRGHGRISTADSAVMTVSSAADVGDEPLLIHRRFGRPGAGGARTGCLPPGRLLQREPSVNVIVADDGLQHRQLRRDVEIVVFDERGLGNGLLLPAGPAARALHAAAATGRAGALQPRPGPPTPWPGALAQAQAGRRLAAGRLAGWGAGSHPRPLSDLRGAAPWWRWAGIAVPERFFAALEAEGPDLDSQPAGRPCKLRRPALAGRQRRRHHDRKRMPSSWPAGSATAPACGSWG